MWYGKCRSWFPGGPVPLKSNSTLTGEQIMSNRLLVGKRVKADPLYVQYLYIKEYLYYLINQQCTFLEHHLVVREEANTIVQISAQYV